MVWIPAVHRLGLLASVVLVGLGTCGSAGAYGWPVKPFARMHAIRGGFDDPGPPPQPRQRRRVRAFGDQDAG